MKRLLTNLFTLSVCILASATAMAQPRQVQSLDFGWRFQAGDVKDAALLTTDDSNWRSVNLPHDFQIEQPWVAPAADEKADNSDAAANMRWVLGGTACT